MSGLVWRFIGPGCQIAEAGGLSLCVTDAPEGQWRWEITDEAGRERWGLDASESAAKAVAISALAVWPEGALVPVELQ